MKTKYKFSGRWINYDGQEVYIWHAEHHGKIWPCHRPVDTFWGKR